jgi:transposase-like protein
MRDYAGVLDDLCDGYGIDKSSLPRQFKAARRRQLRELLERPLGTMRFCVIIVDGSKALAKAVQNRFGGHVPIQRCRLHKERNIVSYLPNKHHKMRLAETLLSSCSISHLHVE